MLRASNKSLIHGSTLNYNKNSYMSHGQNYRDYIGSLLKDY